MHCFVDFKARENEICLANERSEADIPVVIKDANINCTAGTNEIHTKQAVPEPGRRKLSAEKILSAIQRKANTITSSLRMTSSTSSSSGRKSSLRGSPSSPESPASSSDLPSKQSVDRRKLSLPLKKLTTIPSVDYQVFELFDICYLIENLETIKLQYLSKVPKTKQ